IANYNIIRNSRLHDNARVGNRGPGLILSSGVGNLAYNNLVWGNNGGIQIDYNVSDAKGYNNTVYANVANGGWWGVLNGAYTTNAAIVNNIVIANGSTAIENDGSGATTAANFLTDPKFIDASGHDFHLQSGSGAIDKGTSVADVPIDFDGISRPQGAAYDP